MVNQLNCNWLHLCGILQVWVFLWRMLLASGAVKGHVFLSCSLSHFSTVTVCGVFTVTCFSSVYCHVYHHVLRNVYSSVNCQIECDLLSCYLLFVS